MVWECKWDGWRALVYIDGSLRVRTRTGRQVSDSLPELDRAGGRPRRPQRHPRRRVGGLPGRRGGLLCAWRRGMMHTGRTARWAASQVPVTFVAFDLLHLDGQDLTGLPLVERKRLLDELHLVGPAWATNGWYPATATLLFQVCLPSSGTKVVVAKRLDAPYLPGQRSRSWLKRKCPAWKRDHALADGLGSRPNGDRPPQRMFR